jgi:hypothetical protein
MKPEIVFYAVLTITVLSGGAASTIVLTAQGSDPSRMAVALRLAKIAFVGSAALAALLGPAMIS